MGPKTGIICGEEDNTVVGLGAAVVVTLYVTSQAYVSNQRNIVITGRTVAEPV